MARRGSDTEDGDKTVSNLAVVTVLASRDPNLIRLALAAPVFALEGLSRRGELYGTSRRIRQVFF